MIVEEAVTFARVVRKDLVRFADAGTVVEARNDSGTQLSWRMNRRDRELSVVSGDSIVVDGVEISYKDFLAATDMADLLSLAETLVRTSSTNTKYVEPFAYAASDRSEQLDVPALALIQDLVTTSSTGRTNLVFITADAGVGKTTTLRELVRQQAASFLNGKSRWLYFYINAQGRALARFNEAMAVELQDLKTRTTYHSIVPLVREGLVVPVVDGFDELIGAQGGYDDAFNSLASFLEQLDGQGAMVAAARSVYYEQEFVSRANTSSALGSQSWLQKPLQLKEWTTEQVDGYCDLASDGDGRVKEAVRDLFEPDEVRHLRGRPLFVTRVVTLILRGETNLDSAALLDSLIEAYLRREQQEKLLSRTERPLLDMPSLYRYYAELAAEMWRQETRELDSESIRELAELFAAVEDLDEEAQRVLVERAPTLAFMSAGQRPGSVHFEHDTFFSYFVARPFGVAWGENTAVLRSLLSRGLLTDELGQYVVAQVYGDDIDGLSQKALVAARGAVIQARRVEENAGTLLAALFRKASTIEGVSVSGARFAGTSLRGVTFADCSFDSSTFYRTDLRQAVFRRCMARETFLQESIVDKDTRLDITGLAWDSDILGLSMVDDMERLRYLYEPFSVRETLMDLELPSARTVGANVVFRPVEIRVVALINKLSDAFSSSNPISGTDYSVRNLIKDSRWKALESVLEESGVVTREYRATKGVPPTFYRNHVAPSELMAGFLRTASVRPSVEALWTKLEQVFPGSAPDSLAIVFDADGSRRLIDTQDDDRDVIDG